MGSILDVTFDPISPPADCPAGETFGFLPVRNDSDLALKYPYCWEIISWTNYSPSGAYLPPTGANVHPRDFFGADGGFLGILCLCLPNPNCVSVHPFYNPQALLLYETRLIAL